MKICWDNLEKLRLNSRGNLVNKNNAVFIEMEFCINCGEPYLMSRVDPTKFCSIQFNIGIQEATAMGAGVILIKSFVADYCNKSNRHQEKTMPETVFYFLPDNPF